VESQEAASSYVTLIEVLIKPLRIQNTFLANTYRDTLLSSNLAISPIEGKIAELTAEIRSKYNIRIPDAIQVASAILFNSDAFPDFPHLVRIAFPTGDERAERAVQ